MKWYVQNVNINDQVRLTLTYTTPDVGLFSFLHS